MSGNVIRWNGDQLKGILDDEIAKRLATAAEVVRARAVRSVSVSGWAGGSYRPSKPGDPPHADTRQLGQSIFYVVMRDDQKAIVGTNLKKGLFLEVGTSKMRARPYLRPALHGAEIKAIFSKPLPTRGA